MPIAITGLTVPNLSSRYIADLAVFSCSERAVAVDRRR